jgi:hypothetical protein
MKNVFELDDDELEDCFDGSSDVDMVREILQKSNVVDAESRLIDCENFAHWFAQGVEGFIDEDEDTAEWQEAWDNNYEWGMSIADNINDYLEEEDEE